MISIKQYGHSTTAWMGYEMLPLSASQIECITPSLLLVGLLSSSTRHSVTAGDLSSQNSSRLDDLTKQLELYAIDTSVQSQLTLLTKKYDKILDNIQETYTPYSLTQSLQRSTAEYISNLQRLEENLSTKIDRSEIRHVEYLYQELERYQEQIALLEQSSKRFESEFQKFEEVNWKEQKLMREEMDRSWKQVEKDSMARDERIRTQCSQIQQEIRSLQSYVDASFLPLTEQLKVFPCPLTSPLPRLSLSLSPIALL
jgi:phenylalanyl-tRNA synthetase alpha subunit